MTEPPKISLNFAEEFVRHHRSLWLVAMSVVANASDADDVLQEAAIIGLQKVGTFQPGTSFRAWMGAIVRNVALNRRRALRRDIRRFGVNPDALQTAHGAPQIPPSPLFGPVEGSRPASVAGQQPSKGAGTLGSAGQLHPLQTAFDDRVLAALMELAPIPRACLLLRTIDELGYDEIAELLGIPPGTAMSHVFRSRRALAVALAPASKNGGR